MPHSTSELLEVCFNKSDWSVTSMFSRPWRHLESHEMHGTWWRAFIGNMPLTGNDYIEHFKAMLLHSFLPNEFNLSLFSLFHTKWCTTQSAPVQEIPLADVGHFKGQTTKQTSNSHITLLNFKQFTRGTTQRDKWKQVANKMTWI